jgi:glycosyltransferase involved in cell wall biosynthesis
LADRSAPRPRIAFLLPSLKFGGAERVALNLAAALRDKGYDVDFLLMLAEGELLAQAEESFRVVDLRCSRTWKLPGLLARYLRRERPDALISSFWKLNLCACLARIARPATRLALWEHSPPSRSVNSPVRLYAPSATILYRLATRVVAVSNGVEADIRRITRGLGRKLVTVYNPIPEPEASSARTPASGQVIWIGRLDNPKNPHLMIEAFAKVARNDIRLAVLGDGAMRSALEQQARTLGIADRVDFLGFRDDVHPLLGGASVLALTSDREGLPTVLVEALHHGCGIVATDCGEGVREILDDGRLGTIVPVGDAGELARAVDFELARPRDARVQRAGAERFAPAVIAAQFLAALGLAPRL